MEWLEQFFDPRIGAGHLILEIGILSFLIYYVLYFMRGTRGAYVLTGLVMALIGISKLAEVLSFEVIGKLIDEFWAVLAIAMVVIFQPELRRAFAQLGSYSGAANGSGRSSAKSWLPPLKWPGGNAAH